MKKLLILLSLSAILSISLVFAHPGNDLDSATGCHVCTTNCSDYGLIYGEFHCHQTSLDYEIQAIQSYYSSKGFGRSSAADSAIEQARVRFANQSSIVPTYTIPTYTPSSSISSTLLDNYNKLIEYTKEASDFNDLEDYDNAIASLNSALIYAKKISMTQEVYINELIAYTNNKKMIKEFDEEMNYCNNLYGSLSYGYKIGGNIICTCVVGYSLDEKKGQCIKNCIENSSLGTDNQCYCNAGYINSPDNAECVNSNGSELDTAIKWMYINGLTIYSEVETFMGNEYLTRQQASKFFVEFAEKMIGSALDTNQTVSFGDLAKADKTLKSHIIKAAQLGLFKGVKGNFLPFNNLTRAQALAVIVRMVDGAQYEPSPNWYISYYTTAFLTYDILGGLNFDFDTADSVNITRAETALLLYRLITNNIIK